jgi:hypothetical protein
MEKRNRRSIRTAKDEVVTLILITDPEMLEDAC